MRQRRCLVASSLSFALVSLFVLCDQIDGRFCEIRHEWIDVPWVFLVDRFLLFLSLFWRIAKVIPIISIPHIGIVTAWFSILRRILWSRFCFHIAEKKYIYKCVLISYFDLENLTKFDSTARSIGLSWDFLTTTCSRVETKWHFTKNSNQCVCLSYHYSLKLQH